MLSLNKYNEKKSVEIKKMVILLIKLENIISSIPT